MVSSAALVMMAMLDPEPSVPMLTNATTNLIIAVIIVIVLMILVPITASAPVKVIELLMATLTTQYVKTLTNATTLNWSTTATPTVSVPTTTVLSNALATKVIPAMVLTVLTTTNVLLEWAHHSAAKVPLVSTPMVATIANVPMAMNASTSSTASLSLPSTASTKMNVNLSTSAHPTLPASTPPAAMSALATPDTLAMLIFVVPVVKTSTNVLSMRHVTPTPSAPTRTALSNVHVATATPVMVSNASTSTSVTLICVAERDETLKATLSQLINATPTPTASTWMELSTAHVTKVTKATASHAMM